MTPPTAGLVSPEVLKEIRLKSRALLRATESIQASIETGRFDEAAPIAAELSKVLRKHLLLVEGVLDVVSPDDISPFRARR
ncbi:MAG: hypothetical protein OEV36_09110 [Myxococcales bacterium]|nr:hypothetical protein [Myxococcales bacterium]